MVIVNEGDVCEWLSDEVKYFEGGDLNVGYVEEICIKYLFKKVGFDVKGDYVVYLC